MNYVVVTIWLHSYQRLADYLFERKSPVTFQTLEFSAVLWLNEGIMFTFPFRVKFIHLIPLPKCKKKPLILWKLKVLSRLWSLNVPLKIRKLFKITYIYGERPTVDIGFSCFSFNSILRPDFWNKIWWNSCFLKVVHVVSKLVGVPTHFKAYQIKEWTLSYPKVGFICEIIK